MNFMINNIVHEFAEMGRNGAIAVCGVLAPDPHKVDLPASCVRCLGYLSEEE